MLDGGYVLACIFYPVITDIVKAKSNSKLVHFTRCKIGARFEWSKIAT